MGGILDGIKWGIILQLGVAVVLPMVTGMMGSLGNLGGGGGQPAAGGHRPYGDEY